MLQYIAYGVYLIIIGIFTSIAVMGIYHMHRFGADWKRTRYITAMFVLSSSALLIYSIYLMLHISWEDLF